LTAMSGSHRWSPPSIPRLSTQVLWWIKCRWTNLGVPPSTLDFPC
jgi:hypothetical protein